VRHCTEADHVEHHYWEAIARPYPRRSHSETIGSSVGVHERAARYWELKEDKAPTSTLSSLIKIEAVLRDHGVIVFATPTAGVRLATDFAAQRVIIRDQN
jgi:hypothetical protein